MIAVDSDAATKTSHLLILQSCTFSVTDTGAGVSAAEQQQLFEAFVQTESGLAAHQGTGLGLAISAEYAQLMGGQLTVKSVVGEGSTFSLSLMVAPVKASVGVTDAQPPNRKIIGLILASLATEFW